MKGKAERLQAYAELLAEDLEICREKDRRWRCLPEEDPVRNWLFRDFVLSLYLLLYDRQKEQRSLSYANLYRLLQTEAEGTKEMLRKNWPPNADGFEEQYSMVIREGEIVLSSELRGPLKRMRDKCITHHEVKTEGPERRKYTVDDFPELTADALGRLLDQGSSAVIDALSLVNSAALR